MTGTTNPTLAILCCFRRGIQKLTVACIVPQQVFQFVNIAGR